MTPEENFKMAQNPVFWLINAERLQTAAEIILNDQVKQEIPYFKAVDEASELAQALAMDAPDGAGVVEIACDSPNYVPAQLLCAFAIENALKGLIVAKSPEIINERKIDAKLITHDFVALADAAGVGLFPQEIPVAKILSSIATWAGRYPVATKQHHHTDVYPFGPNSEALLDWGSQHPIMRRLVNRLIGELTKVIGKSPSRRGSVVSLHPITK